MSHYAAGANFERKVRDKLYADGAKLVVRSAGSKGPVDLVAFWGGVGWHLNEKGERYRMIGEPRTRLIQVKRNGHMTKAAKDELCALAFELRARAVLAYPEKVGRRVEVRLEVL